MNNFSDDIQRIVERAQSGADDVAEREREARKREAQDALREIVPRGLMDGRNLTEAYTALPESLAKLVTWEWGDGPALLVGASGKGKTTACALLVRRLLRDWVQVGTPQAYKALRASWWRSRALARELQFSPLGKPSPGFEAALKAPLLVLDDLGWEPDPAFVGDLLCERIDNGRPTIATSGQTVEALELRYGQPVIRRLIQRGQLLEAW